MTDPFAARLEKRRSAGRLRSLRRVESRHGVVYDVDGKDAVNFCSNDYLGLSQHPLLKKRAIAFMDAHGVGTGASRLVCGNLACFDMVERKLAELKQTEDALVFPTGFQTNVSLLPAITDENSIIFSDALNHNSIINGVRLSRCMAEVFRHNDLRDLERLLHRSVLQAYSRRIIVTESVFSMDGDMADIAALSAMARRFGALLVVDDAHGFGVFGKNGSGLADSRQVDIIIGTFSKAAGCLGGYIACSSSLKEYLVNYASGMIYTTGTSPALLGAMDAALDLIPEMDDERRRIHGTSDRVRGELNRRGLDVGASVSQIIPVIVGLESTAMELSQALETSGIWAAAIRPPTVPDDQSRLRLTITSGHTDDHIDRLIKVFDTCQGISPKAFS